MRRLLPLLVMPVVLVVILLFIGICRRKRWPIVAGLVLLYLSSIEIVGGHLVAWVESGYPSRVITDVGNADAIVVLGGFFGPRSLPGHLVDLNDAGDRIGGGIALWRSGAAPNLVFTGAHGPSAEGIYSEGQVCMDIAVGAGVPTKAILVSRSVTNTVDEAAAIADLLREKGWERIILVTSASHMRRAAWLFAQAGIVFTPFPVDFRCQSTGWPMLYDIIPNAASLVNTETALREIYGNIYYRIFYSKRREKSAP